MAGLQAKLVDKIAEKIGEERFNRLFLKIYSAGVISELNFTKEEIDEAILPLSQLEIIKVKDAYFRERPDEHKTHYNLYSLTDKGKAVVNSIIKKINVPKRSSAFINKYPLKFLAFVIHFLVTENKYTSYCEEKYERLLEEKEFADLLQKFKQDLKNHKCGFMVTEFTSRRIIGGPPTLILLPEFVNSLRKQLPREIVEKELGEYRLAMYIENYFLKPPLNQDWYKEFLSKIEAEKLKNVWKTWRRKLASEKVLVEHVVMKPNKLKEFLTTKIKRLQSRFIKRSKTEDKLKEFFEILEKRGIRPKEDEKNDILASCETRKDFSAFISAIYKIIHDRMKVKDDKVIDPIRCYFHHDKADKQQEWYKKKIRRILQVQSAQFSA